MKVNGGVRSSRWQREINSGARDYQGEKDKSKEGCLLSETIYDMSDEISGNKPINDDILSDIHNKSY